jgi:hypothetical protein
LGRKANWHSGGLLALLICAVAVGAASAAERAKTDLITLQNGDRITGRILYVQYGILQVSSQHAGSISIEWPSVRSIQSGYSFRVEKLGGEYFAGVINTDPDGKSLVVGTGTHAVTIPMEQVARVVPYEADFWQRIDGSVSLGYNFTKSSGVSQGSFDFSTHYSDAALEAALDAQVSATHAPQGNSSDQSQVTSSVYFLRPGPNFWGLLGALQRDQNLGIDGRVLFGAALGRHLYETADARLQGIVGLVFDQEWAAGGGSSQNSLEGVFGGEWRVFRFSYPKINLDTSLLLYPGITDAPRVRGNLNITLTFKLTDRFSIRLSEFGNYDSRPPAVGAQTLDYGITTSMGYDFGAVVP